MTFSDDKLAASHLADAVLKAGTNLFKASKYLYALTKEHYVNCNIKDFMKVLLNNIYDADKLRVFHISTDGPSCEVLNTREYFNLLRLIIYSFGVRLPLLCSVPVDGQYMTEKQVEAVYKIVQEKGIVGGDNAITETFADCQKAVKKGLTDIPYNADWFGNYIYASVPELSDLSSSHLLFLGAMNILLTLYYLQFEKDLQGRITLLALNRPVSF